MLKHKQPLLLKEPYSTGDSAAVKLLACRALLVIGRTVMNLNISNQYIPNC